jgi:hypothetical protein
VTRAEQKTEERRILELVCELHGDLGLEDIDTKHTERPDFITKDRRIGIELAEYHQDLHVNRGGSEHRQREAVDDRLVHSAQLWYEANAPVPRLDVYFFPVLGDRPHTRALKSHGATLGRAILDAVASGRDELSGEEVPEELQHFVSAVSFSPPPVYSPERPGKWQRVEATWLEVIVPALEHLIRDKDRLVSAYRAVAKEIWLVVHSARIPVVGSDSPIRASSTGRATPELLNSVFETAFDKILFLDLEGPRLSALKTARARGFGSNV